MEIKKKTLPAGIVDREEGLVWSEGGGAAISVGSWVINNLLKYMLQTKLNSLALVLVFCLFVFVFAVSVISLLQLCETCRQWMGDCGQTRWNYWFSTCLCLLDRCFDKLLPLIFFTRKGFIAVTVTSVVVEYNVIFSSAGSLSPPQLPCSAEPSVKLTEIGEHNHELH